MPNGTLVVQTCPTITTCYKVLLRCPDGKLRSWWVDKLPRGYVRIYGKEKVVRRGFCFDNAAAALQYDQWSGRQREVWEANCSFIQHIKWRVNLYSNTLLDDLRSWAKGIMIPNPICCYSFYLGHDIRLIRRIDDVQDILD